MAGLTDKEKWEQKVFVAFAKRCGLKISECSIESRKPPMPDIYCNFDGSNYFFELAEVVPQSARAVCVHHCSESRMDGFNGSPP